mgnify:CR=1 FL=1
MTRVTVKDLWVLIAIAIAVAILAWLGPVDFARAQSLEEIVRDSEGGQMPSREEFDRRGGESHQPVPDVRPDSAVPDPQGESTQPMKEGESPGRDRPRDSATPPGGSESGAAGRVSTPAVWGFIAWSATGERMGGRLRDTREDCETLLAEHRGQHPDWLFSPCVWVRAVRETL